LTNDLKNEETGALVYGPMNRLKITCFFRNNFFIFSKELLMEAGQSWQDHYNNKTIHLR